MKHVMKVKWASIALCIILIGCNQSTDKIDKARVTVAKANLRSLHEAVNQFKTDTGRYPSEDEGLTALIEKPSDVENWNENGYLQLTEIPKDSWGNDFIYELSPGADKPFAIRSLGADGKEGGKDYNADLSSTDLM